MGRRRRNSVVPFVVLGAAVSIGVVALTASRFGWRRTKIADEVAQPPATDEPANEVSPPPVSDEPVVPAAQTTQVRRFASAVRWDASPEEYAAARASGDPPAP
jgi:hypothetical protein